MHNLELKVPPPLVALACAAGMFGLARLVPGWRWHWPPGEMLGAWVALLGVALDALGLRWRREFGQ